MTNHSSPGNPAEVYQAHMVPTMFQPWSEELLDRAAPGFGEHGVDIACGTGVVARGAAAKLGPDGSVCGIDISPAMLDVARSVPVPEGPRVEWIQGRAEMLPFPNATFDVALCQQGVQFFGDRAVGIGEMYRVLKRGGRAGVSVWRGPEHQSVKGALLVALQRWFGPGVLLPYSFGNADALRMLFENAGFGEVRLEVVRRQMSVPSVDEFIAMTVTGASAAVPALASATEEERGAAIRSVREQIADEIAAVQVGEGMAFPMESHIVIARK